MYLVAIAIGTLALLILIGAFITYRMAFFADQKKRDVTRVVPNDEQYNPYREKMLGFIEELAARPFERVEIRTRDGKRLTGRYYHQADGAPLDIGFHGYKSNSVRDFCGGSRIGFALGHNLLLPDQRAHGESDGHTITFGIRERHDCLAWINYANERFGADTRIVLYGVSMGAATVLMATGLELPKNVRGVIADCPYSSPSGIIRKVCVDRKLPPKPLFPLLRLGAILFGGFRLNDRITAVEAVKRATVPILILHGDDDRFVPHEMSEEVRLANPDRVQRSLFPNAGHALSYIMHEEQYTAEVREFLALHGVEK